jgi:prepilin-type N-terminal cleavage/methylation domain-containing protein
MNMRMKSKNGFTLIELLVVIAIIGVLSTIVLSSLNKARARARDAARKVQSKQLNTALRMYFYDHNNLPKCGAFDADALRGDGTGPGGFVVRSYEAEWNSCLMAALVPQYLSKILVDPINTISDGLSLYYYLTCSADNASDSECGTIHGGITNIYLETFPSSPTITTFITP